MVRWSVIAFDADVSFYYCKSNADELASRISKFSNNTSLQKGTGKMDVMKLQI